MANSDDRILLNLVLNEATVSAVEGRVRNLVNRLNNQNISLNINGRNLDNILNRLGDIQQRMQTINSTPLNINANLTSAQQQYRLETERMRVAQQLELSRQRTLQTENHAISALAQQNRTLMVNGNVTHQIQQNTQNIGNNMNVAGGHARDFVDYLSDGVRYLVTYRSLYAIMKQIGEAFSEMKNVDTAAIQVRKTTGMSKDEIEAIKKASYGVATEYGRSASEYLESVSEFARAGYKQHSTELGKLSLLTQNVGDVSAESADKMLLAVDAAYRLEGNVTELTNVVNALNNIANKNPTSMQKMADGLQVSASMAKTAGMDISELTALIGTGTAVTQREGAEVARAIRTIVMNVKSIKGELEDGTIIDDESIAKAEAALKGVGISTKEVVNGVRELRNPMEVLDELADKWHTLGTEAKSVLTESIANKRQANVLSGILDNWSMVEKMQSEYFNSANSAIEENILYLEGWEAKSKVVNAKWTEYISNLADTKVITGTLDALYGLLTALDTPIGRIVTQIVLVNTALAVTGRLWRQIRARSIVAEILSIGVADRQLGTAIGLVTEHLGRQALAWATSPFGMATIAVAGITLISSAIEKNSQKLEENAQKAGEAYDKVKQNMNELDDLIKQYNDLQISNEWDNTSVETKKQLHEDINRLLGDEADKVDILNGKYKETTEELFKQRMSKLPEEEKKAFDNEQAKGETLWDTVWWNNGIRTSYTSVLSDEEEKALDKYSHIFTSDHTTANGEEVHNYQLKFDNLQDFLYKYNEVKNLLQDMYNEGLGETETYKELNDYISQFETKFNDYKTAVEELKNSKVSSKLADFINANVGGYVDDLDEYKIVVDWVQSNFTGKDADNALGLLNAYFSEYAKKVSETNKLFSQEGLSVSLSDLSTASEALSSLSKAFKELNDDGYITTDTITKIKEATGLGEEEWKKYESTLLNAKVGSDEYNRAMSELTYKILENKIGLDKLTEADEDYITAVLRENGVLNANEVAREAIARAIAKQKIQSELSSDASKESIQALVDEAESCDIARDAYIGLIAEEILFGRNDLDVSQKIGALKELAMHAGITGELISSILDAPFEKSSEVQRAWAEKHGWSVEAKTDSNGNAITVKNSKGEQVEDWVWTKDGVSVENAMEASLHDAKDYFGDYFNGNYSFELPDYTSPSTKNEALDNYLKEAESRYKIHQNETEYIDDLNHALSNLAKTDEERLEITEKINEAYRDSADNTIKDLEHQIDLKKELYGEDYNSIEDLNNIQKVAHDEADRLRKMGYDDNSSEIQALQKTWWDAENSKLDFYSKQHENIIRDIEHARDMALEINPYADTTSYYKQLQAEYHKEADRLRALDPERYKEEIQKLQDSWWKAQNEIYDIRKEAFEKYTDFGTSYFGSKKTLLQSYYDVTNAIAEAQHEINKELEASKTMYEWLDEETRELLFNQEDYNVLSEELYDIQYKADKLQRQYQHDLDNSTLDTIEQITSNYEMQYETLMKSYEIAKADLDIAKKKAKLNNVLNERNVRMFINGQWQWVANTEDVAKAKAELADAEYARKTAEAGARQTDAINALITQENQLAVIINKFNSGVIDLDTAIGLAEEAIGKLPSALSKLLNVDSSSANNIFSNSASGTNKSVPKSNHNATATIPGVGEVPIYINSSGKTVTDGLPVGTIVHTAAGDYRITGGTAGNYSSDKIKKYATGSGNTQSGTALMGEKEPEVFIDSEGHLISINQPTILDIEHGGIVFNQEQLQNMKSLWELSSRGFNTTPRATYDYVTKNTETHNDNSIHFDKLVVDGNSPDGQAFINMVRRFVGNH